MKTLYIPDSSAGIVIDSENQAVKQLPSEREAISRIFIAKEDMHVVYEQNGEQKICNIDAGNLLIVFYDHTFKNRVVVVNSSEWIENIKDYNEREQKRKEEWAKKEAEKGAIRLQPCDDTDESADPVC